MGIFVFNCPYCGKQIGAQDEWEGKTSLCPHCQKPVVIRHPAPAVPTLPVSDAGGGPNGPQPQPMVPDWEGYDVGHVEVCSYAKNAMWFGIASVCCCQICSIVALVFGILGLNEIKKSNGRLEGKAYAWIGIGLAVVPWIMTILQMIFAPQLMDSYMKLFEKYLNPDHEQIEYQEEVEEIDDGAQVEPRPEPKPLYDAPQNDQKERQEERSVPVRQPGGRQRNPEELI